MAKSGYEDGTIAFDGYEPNNYQDFFIDRS
jgi:hypothetical protein